MHLHTKRVALQRIGPLYGWAGRHNPTLKIAAKSSYKNGWFLSLATSAQVDDESFSQSRWFLPVRSKTVVQGMSF